LNLGGVDVVMHAESTTHFYALTTDVQCDFDFMGATKKLSVTVGEDSAHPMTMEKQAP